MRLLFVHSEHYCPWQEELLYVFVRQRILDAGIQADCLDFVRTKEEGTRDPSGLARKLLAQVAEDRPDMVFYISSWHDLDLAYLGEIRKMGVRIAGFITDSAHPPATVERAIFKHCNYVFILDSLTRYAQLRLLFDYAADPRDKGVLFYSGYHVDPELFAPSSVPEEVDVALVGSIEGSRVQLHEHLTRVLPARGISYAHFGGLVDSRIAIPEDGLSAPRLSWDDYRRTIHKARILLIPGSGINRPQVKGKFFEFLSSQRFCLIEECDEYHMLAPEGCAAFFSTLQELHEGIDRALQDEAYRQTTAARGRAWFLENFDNRIFWTQFFKAAFHGTADLPRPPGHCERLIERSRKQVYNSIDWSVFRSAPSPAPYLMELGYKPPTDQTPLINPPPEYRKDLVRQANLRWAEGNFTEALRRYQWVSDYLTDDEREAIDLRMRACRAIVALKERMSEGADALECALALGTVFRLTQRYDLAGFIYQRLAKSHANHPLLLQHQGLLHHVQGELDKAERSFERAVEMNPGDADAFLSLALVRDERGHPPLPPFLANSRQTDDIYETPEWQVGADVHDPGEFFRRHGCVLVRGALDPALPHTIRRLIQDALEGSDAEDSAQEGLGDESILLSHFLEDGGTSLSSSLLQGGLAHHLESIAPGTPRLFTHGLRFRRFAPGQGQPRFRQEGASVFSEHPLIMCWIPFHPCGVDAPSLELLPIGFKSLLPTNEEGEINPGVIDTHLGALSWRPIVNAGDVIFFSSTTVHRANRTGSMTSMGESLWLSLEVDARPAHPIQRSA